MASSYPGALDDLVNPTDSDTLDDPPHHTQHADANNAIEAVQAELGIDPAGPDSTVVDRLDRMDGTINTGADDELTIAAGVVAVTADTSHYTIDTESDAASDDLDTISNGTDGQIIILRAENDARTVVVKDATDNIYLSADMSLTHTRDTLVLLCIGGTEWVELSRSDNGT